MKLVIVHYHFFPGGVTSSVRSGLLALHREGVLEGCRVILLCGHERGVKDLSESFERAKLRADIHVLPELFYKQEKWRSKEEFESEAFRIKTLLKDQIRGRTLFWVHNPTIGKNPALTRALADLSRTATERKLPCFFLYHIHDFAECGRPNNLAFLKKCHPGGGLTDLYPQTGNVSFVCINTSDCALLRDCGVPASRVYWLPNVIECDSEIDVKPGTKKVAAAVSKYARKHGYVFFESDPWWLMPIRLIRRKNALEAFFLAAAAGHKQVLITLDANSVPEYPYANAVKDALRATAIPGVVGFGAELVGRVFAFDELIRSSESIVTTSLMEGFGFAFLEGPIRGVPLAGRNLPHVTKDFSSLGLPMECLYDEFLVPVSPRIRNGLEQKFIEFATKYADDFRIPRETLDTFCARIAELYERRCVDFGYLDLAAQLELLRQVKDAGFARELRELNKKYLDACSVPPDLVFRVKRAFGPKEYARRVKELFILVETVEGTGKIPSDLGGRIIEKFFQPHFFRPLFW